MSVADKGMLGRSCIRAASVSVEYKRNVNLSFSSL